MPAKEFIPGTLKIVHLPKVQISQIPNAIDFSDKNKLDQMISSGKLKKNELDQEITEGNLFDGVTTYFKNLPNPEDVFIMQNQDLCDHSDNTWHERDLVLVNLSRAYIMNIEAQAKLDHKDKVEKFQRQLNKTKSILKNTFHICSGDNELEEEWKIITILYTQDLSVQICKTLQKFIISKDDNFLDKFSSILNQHTTLVNSLSYINDFYIIVSELLPERVRIGKELVKTFQRPLNEVILEKVTRNVEEFAGSTETISFWSQDQYSFVCKWRQFKRVLFDSGYSTGKTILMMECSSQLLREGQKVLFLIRTYEPNTKPILLKLKLEGFFQGLTSPVPVDFKILQCDFSDNKVVLELLKNHQEYHIFIDELIFGRGAVTIGNIIDWSTKHTSTSEKYFWIAIAYGKGNKGYDPVKLKPYFEMPNFKIPARNPTEIVQLVKDHENSLCSGWARTYWGKCMSQLIIPNNLPKTFKPIILSAIHYKDALEKSLKGLQKVFQDFVPILFLISIYTNMIKRHGGQQHDWFNCGCYNSQMKPCYPLSKQFENHIEKVFAEMRRPKPILYWTEVNELESKSWILNNKSKKDRDLITPSRTAYGFENNVIVVIQENEPQNFDINMSMRSTAMLVVVNMPKEQLNNLCFGACLKSILD